MTRTDCGAFTFRAMWPIVDPTVPLADLIAEATADMPNVITRAHARLTAPGRWSMAPSAAIPGSGRITETVLIYDAPAVTVRRPYHRDGARTPAPAIPDDAAREDRRGNQYQEGAA